MEKDLEGGQGRFTRGRVNQWLCMITKGEQNWVQKWLLNIELELM